mmetsp:Transcript_30557/g.101648  ORF Transcript_30557/g.101648 Transcript_30557/m.101648 type:complete len:201 (+) Transcript_30557:242-844(+)
MPRTTRMTRWRTPVQRRQQRRRRTGAWRRCYRCTTRPARGRRSLQRCTPARRWSRQAPSSAPRAPPHRPRQRMPHAHSSAPWVPSHRPRRQPFGEEGWRQPPPPESTALAPPLHRRQARQQLRPMLRRRVPSAWRGPAAQWTCGGSARPLRSEWPTSAEPCGPSFAAPSRSVASAAPLRPPAMAAAPSPLWAPKHRGRGR